MCLWRFLSKFPTNPQGALRQYCNEIKYHAIWCVSNFRRWLTLEPIRQEANVNINFQLKDDPIDHDKKLNTLFSIYVLAALIKLSCRETGLDCDFIIEGETEEQFLALGAEHAIKVHGLRAEEIFLNAIPCNFLCHSFSKPNDDNNS